MLPTVLCYCFLPLKLKCTRNFMSVLRVGIVSYHHLSHFDNFLDNLCGLRTCAALIRKPSCAAAHMCTISLAIKIAAKAQIQTTVRHTHTSESPATINYPSRKELKSHHSYASRFAFHCRSVEFIK